MKWITNSVQRILGLSDSSDFFEPKAHQIRVRVKVAAGAALLCGIGVVVVSIITSAAMSSSTEVVVPDELQATTAVQIPPEHSGLGAVLVHVVGEVVTPGMYELPRHSRLIDAVMAAGGLTGNAGECAVNLARFVSDGEQIKIPTREEGCSGQVGSPTGNLVSLNQATSEQIDSLPGIGPTLAERIVQWREKNGGFTSIEQLNEVSGIGDKLYAGLKDLVTL